VADTANNRVRKITSVGVVTTIAGSGTAGWVDGLSTSAQLNQPKGVTIDPGGSVYVADQGNNAIRMISTSNYVSTVAGTGSNTYADGTGTAAALGSPIDIAINSSGLMYVSDSNDEHIRTLSVASGDSLVTWTAPSANGGQSPTSYTVTSSPGGLTCTSSTTNCAIAGLTNGTAYTFTVTATNGTGTGSASSASNSFTPVTTPGAPTSASAVTAGTGKASVSWTAPASTGGSSIIRYNVTSNVGSHTCTTTSTTCTVSGLTSGSTYTFTVTATNGVGTGPASTATHSIVST
jgi:hypothetical protein